MARVPRFGLWFGNGLDNALAARAVLGDLQTDNPGADWVLFGPRDSLFLFEMDERVPVYIPLRALEPRRPAQSRLSYYLEKRTQSKKLRGLGLVQCFGVAVLQRTALQDTTARKLFEHALSMLGVGGELLHKAHAEFAMLPRPELQAGPQALAFATRLYRKVPPNQPKHLLLLGQLNDQDESVEVQWQQAKQMLVTGSESVATVNLITAVITLGNRLMARHLAKAHPDWLQVDAAQAMGLIAYADRVICCSGAITRICVEMGRSDRLLLGKSDT